MGGEFTVAEVTDVISQMADRLRSGQGGLHNAICRLSLPMSNYLLSALESALAGESAALEEVARLRDLLNHIGEVAEKIAGRHLSGHPVWWAVHEILSEISRLD